MDTPSRRKQERVKSPKVLLKIPTVARLRTYYLKDLSEGGAFIRLSSPLPVGSFCTVELEAPGLTEPLALKAKVVRCVLEATQNEPAGMGVQFENAEPAAMERLRALLEEHRVELSAPKGKAARKEATPLPTVAPEVKAEPIVAPPAAQAAPVSNDRVAELQNQLDARSLENADLKTELLEAQGRLSALEDQLKTVEEDEATSRDLAETLAAEKSKGDKQAHDEVVRLKGELKETQAKLDVARAEVNDVKSKSKAEKDANQAEVDKIQEGFAAALAARDDLHTSEKAEQAGIHQRAMAQANERIAKGEAAEEARVETDRKLQAQIRQTQVIEKKLSEVQTDFDRLRRRESALRHLVSVMSAANLTKGMEGAGKASPDAAALQAQVAAAVAPAPQPMAAAEPSVIVAAELSPPAPHLQAVPTPAEATAEPVLAKGDGPPTKPHLVPLPSPDASIVESDSEGDEALQQAASEKGELDVQVDVDDASNDEQEGEVPEFDVQMGEDSPTPALSLADFTKSLEQGARVHSPNADQAQQVPDPGERMIALMLKEELGLEELLERASAHPVRDQFVEMLYRLFQRRAITWVPPANAQPDARATQN